MPKLLQQAPVLMVSNLAASLDYWRQCVGFAFNTFGDPADFAIGRRDGCFLMLGQADKDQIITPNWHLRHNTWNAYFWVDDAKALYEELLGSGAKIDYTLCKQPYNVLEFGIQDLDGQDIGFGQDLDA